MKQQSRILQLYEKIERLAMRLPEQLRQPILQEITPVKDLFLRQRPPRMVLLGERGTGKTQLINALFDAEIIAPRDEQTQGEGWHDFTHPQQGTIRVLDARRPVSRNLVKSSLSREAPDIFLFLRPSDPIDEKLGEDLDFAIELMEWSAGRHGGDPATIGLLVGDPDLEEVETARQELHACLHTRGQISEKLLATLAISPVLSFAAGAGDARTRRRRRGIDGFAQLIATHLPNDAKLEMARLSGVGPVQADIAQTLIKSFSAVCGAIGTQPIPLADFPILTSLQVTMVAGIMYISGREMSAKAAAEFIAALGASVGVGLALREGARAALKFLPGWGNAVSGAIAGAGTYALGRAATAYFVEGIPLPDARKLLRSSRARKPRELPEASQH